MREEEKQIARERKTRGLCSWASREGHGSDVLWATVGLLGLEFFVGFGLVKTNLVLGQIGPGLGQRMGQSLGFGPNTKIILKVKIKYNMINANLKHDTSKTRHELNSET